MSTKLYNKIGDTYGRTIDNKASGKVIVCVSQHVTPMGSNWTILARQKGIGQQPFISAFPNTSGGRNYIEGCSNSQVITSNNRYRTRVFSWDSGWGRYFDHIQGQDVQSWRTYISSLFTNIQYESGLVEMDKLQVRRRENKTTGATEKTKSQTRSLYRVPCEYASRTAPSNPQSIGSEKASCRDSLRIRAAQKQQSESRQQRAQHGILREVLPRNPLSKFQRHSPKYAVNSVEALTDIAEGNTEPSLRLPNNRFQEGVTVRTDAMAAIMSTSAAVER